MPKRRHQPSEPPLEAIRHQSRPVDRLGVAKARQPPFAPLPRVALDPDDVQAFDQHVLVQPIRRMTQASAIASITGRQRSPPRRGRAAAPLAFGAATGTLLLSVPVAAPGAGHGLRQLTAPLLL